jgi:hypothetical protein
VLEQLDLLGEILPDLRAGFAEGRPAHVPDAPTHAARVAALPGEASDEDSEEASA